MNTVRTHTTQLWICMGLLLALVLAIPASASDTETPPKHKIICFGDCISRGMWWEQEVGAATRWVSLLAQNNPELMVINAGRDGLDTGHLGYIHETLNQHPDVEAIVLFLGMNDLRQVESYDEKRVKLAKVQMGIMIDSIQRRAPQADIVLVSPLDIAPDRLVLRWRREKFGKHTHRMLADISKAYRELAEAKQITFVSLFEQLPVQRMPDGVHPDAEGHRQIASLIGAGLEQTALLREPDLPVLALNGDNPTQAKNTVIARNDRMSHITGIEPITDMAALAAAKREMMHRNDVRIIELPEDLQPVEVADSEMTVNPMGIEIAAAGTQTAFDEAMRFEQEPLFLDEGATTSTDNNVSELAITMAGSAVNSASESTLELLRQEMPPRLAERSAEGDVVAALLPHPEFDEIETGANIDLPGSPERLDEMLGIAAVHTINPDGPAARYPAFEVPLDNIPGMPVIGSAHDTILYEQDLPERSCTPPAPGYSLMVHTRRVRL